MALLVDGDARSFASSGSGDLEGSTPLTEDSRFRIASITKPLVGALVMTAVDRGELSLDDVVSERLPDTLRTEPPVTVRQLLAHTSGVFDITNEGDAEADVAALTDPALREEARDLLARYAAGERVIASDRLLVALAETHPRYFEPGAGYHYSNVNYQLAAMILEAATGESLADLLAARIGEPLGLERTSIAPPDLGPPEMRGYDTGEDGAPVDVTDDLLAFGNGGNGGILSTPEELFSMLRATVRAELFPARLVDELSLPGRNNYGLGLATYRFRCGTFLGHGGSVNGTQSIAVVSADGERGFVLAVNRRGTVDPNLVAAAEMALCGPPAGG
jgi:D-alanyl-D-alanine carboxypeptidase